ncbi:RPA-interacting protein A-like [Oopsacas minuta]|uniref:RPA-interacting protein A-like n=1 Tax=Oopsacas minuta TaxID=111878 RepID=A0AAV7JD72_9METZ|nr:RPA-interacting protein A-like [Oopsacas minuta]
MQSNSQERLESYKNGGKHYDWKCKYRQKCLDRLKTGRRKVQDQFRHLSVTSTSEAYVLAKEISSNLVEEVLTDTNTYIETDKHESLVDELSEELKEIVIEWALSQEMWETAMEQLENKNLICPICRQNYLYEGGTMITCSCGLQLDNEVLNLKQLEKKLEEATSRHCNSICEGKLEFRVVEMEDISLSVLNMQCNLCGVNELIV